MPSTRLLVPGRRPLWKPSDGPGQLRVDWSHPSALALNAFFLFNEGAGTKIWDLALPGRTGTLDAAATWNTSPFGPRLVAGNTSTQRGTFSSSVVTTGSSWSVEVMYFQNAAQVGGACVLTNGNNYGVTLDPAGTSFSVDGTGQTAETTAMSTNTWYHEVLSWDGTTSTFWRNGQANGSGTGAGSTAPATFDSWAGASVALLQLSGSIAWFRVWSRIVGGAEAAALFADPFGMLIVPSEDVRTFAVLSGQPPAATVTTTTALPHGQWPNAPLRTTQRLPLTTRSHTLPGGVNENDDTAAAAEQFYGDGTQSVLSNPHGQWPNAPLRGTQRIALLTRAAGYNPTAAGINENDLTRGNVDQFYGVYDLPTAPPAAPVYITTYPVTVHGQWPNAPLRGTQRLPLTTRTHNVGTGVAENDDTVPSGEEFYGDGTQLLLRNPHGQWPVAPLRSTQRQALTTQAPGYNATKAGVNENDLTRGNVDQFYGVIGRPGTQLADATIPVAAVSTLVESAAQVVAPATIQSVSILSEASAQVVEPTAPLVASDVLSLSVAQVVEPIAPLVASDVLSLTVAQVVEPTAPLEADSVYSETLAQLVAPATLQSASILSETSAQIVEPVAPLVASDVLSLNSAQVVEPTAPLIASDLLSETSAQVVEPVAPLEADSAFLETAAQLVDPNIPVQATSILNEIGTIFTPPSTVAAPATIHGQWPNAPLRETQRLPLTTKAHNVFAGISENDDTLPAAEEFYGDGTQLLLRNPHGQWPVAPLRSTQRFALTTLAPGYNSTALGVNENDLTRGNVDQFYGVIGMPGTQLADATIPIQAISTLVESAAQVVEPVAPLVATDLLSLSVAQVVEPTAPLQATSVYSETVVQLIAPATIQAVSALVETAQLLAPATLQATSVLAEAAQILAPAAVQSNSVLSEAAQLVDRLATLQATSILDATGSSSGGPTFVVQYVQALFIALDGRALLAAPDGHSPFSTPDGRARFTSSDGATRVTSPDGATRLVAP
jgi:hypothetical protein